MKKLYIYLLLSFVCFFGFSMGVKANQYLCKYEGEGVKESKADRWLRVNLFYDYGLKDYIVEIENLKINENGEKTSTYGGVPETKIVYENNDKNQDSFFRVGVDNFICPKYVKVFEKSIKNYRVCFGNTSSIDCKSGVSNSYKSIEGISIEKLNLNNIKNGDKCTASLPYTDKDKNEKVLNIEYTLDSFGTGLIIRYNCGNGFQELVNSNGSTFSCGGQGFDLRNGTISTANNSVIVSSRNEFDYAFIKKWNDNNGDCKKMLNIDQTDKDGVNPLLLPEAQDECMSGGCSNSNAKGFVNLEDWNYNWAHWYNKENEYNNCESLIGDKITATINDILLYVRILIPLLLIGLGVADFVKAMISPDETAMKKAQNKFIKRLLIAAVIFLIPSLVNLLFDLVNGVWAHINNSACNIWN